VLYGVRCSLFQIWDLSQRDCACRRLHDHERVERCDMMVATDVSGGECRGVARGGTASCDYNHEGRT